MSGAMIGVTALSMLGMFFVLLYIVRALGKMVADREVAYQTEERRKKRQRRHAGAAPSHPKEVVESDTF